MLSKEICEKVLAVASSTGADYAEIYEEYTVNHTVHMIASQVDAVKDTVIAGVGIRVCKGLRCVNTSTVDTTEQGLIRCAQQAADALGQGSAPMEIRLSPVSMGNAHPVKLYPVDAPNAQKVEILKDAYFAAKEYHASVSQVTGVLLDVDHSILVANSEGLYARDRQVRTRLSLSAVAEHDGQTQTGNSNPGRLMGLEMFEEVSPRAVGLEAARQAVTMVHAGYCPAGVMPVAIDNGFGGVIFHEACGHSLESAAVAFGQSQFAGKLGQVIASDKVTAIDDGTIPNAWGSMNMDDEGTPARKNVLIENGVLKSYMIDKMGGRRMGMQTTGNCRRQGYGFAPCSRMTNTYIAPGTDSNEDIIASMEYGLYARNMGGGSVNPVTGEFNFAVTEGYMVRNGKICEPVRGASLVGKGSQVLMDIDMVGTAMEMGQGMCGASSGSVPTNVGQPMIRVSGITVGGR